ncbi:hypothetical protein LCGC14_0295090 [marine sediment metagenome]|uniref:Uncharacterized protein n=1 Tax=marine sediment metagenome TaxID=412755 RepID=A0A0F9WDF2_9ZZZZ
MPIRINHLIDVTLDDVPTSQAATHDFQGVTPRRVTLYLQIVKTNAPTNVILTVEFSPDDGQTLIDYDKLLTEAGTDGPVASVTYTVTGDDVVSMAPEDVLDYIKVTMTGTGTTPSATFAVDVWLLYSY